MSEAGKQKLLALEIGRGVAALMVVLHHADQATAYFSSTLQPRLFTLGQYGVDFFFVLSGFIIVYTHKADPKGLAAAKRYVWKRALRVYTPYLPIAFAYMLLLLRFQAGAVSDRPWGFWATLTLLPMDKASTITVAWTLTYEILFYTLFLLNYVSTRVFLAAAALWVGYLLAILSGLAARPSGNAFLTAVSNPIVLEFFCGVTAAYLVQQLPRGWRLGLFASGAALLVAAVATWTGQRVVLAPPLALIVLGCAKVDLDENAKGMRFTILVGAASYAIYLIHSPVISIVARLMQPLDLRWATFLACCILGTSAGLLYHLAFEKPALSYVRGRVRRAMQLA